MGTPRWGRCFINSGTLRITCLSAKQSFSFLIITKISEPTFICPSCAINMLSGLRSRWTIPKEWRYSRARTWRREKLILQRAQNVAKFQDKDGSGKYQFCNIGSSYIFLKATDFFKKREQITAIKILHDQIKVVFASEWIKKPYLQQWKHLHDRILKLN